MPLEDLRGFLLGKGITVALMAEHAEDFDTDSYDAYRKELAAASDNEFLFVPGLEFRCAEGPHIAGLGLDGFIPGVPTAGAWLESMREAGAFTVLAHPSHPPLPLYAGFARLFHAVEVWNVPCEGGWLPDPRKFDVYHSMREKNPDLLAVGGIDLHSTDGYKRVIIRMECGRSWDEIWDCLVTGRFEIEAGRWRYGSRPRLGALERLLLGASHFGYRSGRAARDGALRLKQVATGSAGKTP
jgi:hypothetical protein